MGTVNPSGRITFDELQIFTAGARAWQAAWSRGDKVLPHVPSLEELRADGPLTSRQVQLHLARFHAIYKQPDAPGPQPSAWRTRLARLTLRGLALLHRA